jgi:two-component system, cell cycle response regulator
LPLGHHVCLLLLNLERFEEIFNTYGHSVSAAFLKRITCQILACLDGSIDWCAHLGGEDFVVVLEETALADARERVDRVCQAIRAGFIDTSEGMIRVTVNFGISAAEELADKTAVTVESLLKMACASLCLNKARGRNRAASPNSSSAQLRPAIPAADVAMRAVSRR